MTDENVNPTILQAGTEEAEQPTNLERDLSANQEPQKPVEEAKPEKGSRNSVEKALDKIQAAEKVEKTEEKVEAEKPAPKPQPKEEKPEVAASADDKAGKEATEKPRQSERRDYPEPPSRFLPREKELWRNAPLPVQQAVARTLQENETEISQYRQSHQEYETLRPFVERAKAGGTDLKTALESYVGMEDKLRSNPAEGFRTILANMNMQPYQAIGSILQAFGVPPHIAAKHLADNPHMYAPQQSQPQQIQQTQQVPQQLPEVQQLQKQVEEMRQQQILDTVVAPFRQSLGENDRFLELQDDIAFFLNSGKIPSSLSPIERLEAAYDMAERINPSSHTRQAAPQQFEEDPETTPQRRAEPDLNGTKSVKGAPSGGSDITPRKAYKNPRDAVKAAMSSLGM